MGLKTKLAQIETEMVTAPHGIMPDLNVRFATQAAKLWSHELGKDLKKCNLLHAIEYHVLARMLRVTRGLNT